MKHDVLDINDYLELCERRNKNDHFLLIFFLLLFFLVFIYFFKVDTYYKTEGYVLDDLFVVTVLQEKVETITKGKYVYIDNIKYQYSIYEIKEEVITYGEYCYKEIQLKINLDDKLNYDYNILKVRFETKRETFLKIIFEKIKEGL